MIKRISYSSILLWLFSSLSSLLWGATEEDHQSGTGVLSNISIEHIGRPIHEVTLGKSIIRLMDSRSGKELFKKEENGIFYILGFNSTTRDFILGKVLEDGGTLPVAAFYYVNEQAKTFRESKHNWKELRVFASESSPTGSFIACIGYIINTELPARLIILDTKKDEYRITGAAPFPPPLNDTSDCDVWKQRDVEDAWGWSVIFVDGYIKMDPGIISFPDSCTMRVSYGPDTCRKRSKARTLKDWSLVKLFQVDEKK